MMRPSNLRVHEVRFMEARGASRSQKGSTLGVSIDFDNRHVATCIMSMLTQYLI